LLQLFDFGRMRRLTDARQLAETLKRRRPLTLGLL
jgi:hypothetical protein